MLTGLKINFAKSLIFGVRYGGDLSVFSSLLGCYNGTLPTTYLGLPLGDKCGGVEKWDKIIDRFIARLAGWKKPLLSRADKISLINIVLDSLHVYYMSLYEMHVSILRKLEKIMRNFQWNDNKREKKIHHVKWNALYNKKKFGGLGIKRLDLMNQDLLFKWYWRYVTENDALWKDIVTEKYGVGDVVWSPKIPKCTFGRSVWKEIMKFNPIFLKFVRFKVNNGNLVRF